MKDRKHTHTGSCQICGSVQAVNVKTGLLAKHGYTTRWGFFSGTCTGSDGIPYEQGFDLIEAAIARAELQAAATRVAAKGMRARTGNVGFCTSYEKDPRTGKSAHFIVECSYRDIEKTSGTYTYNTIEATYTKHHLKDGQPVVVVDSGPNAPGHYSKSAAEAAKKSREVEAHKLDCVVKQLENYIAWQTPRVTDWKPGKLTPVAAEPAPIKVGDKFSAYENEWTVTAWGYSRRSIRSTQIIKATRARDGYVGEFRPQDVRKFLNTGA